MSLKALKQKKFFLYIALNRDLLHEMQNRPNQTIAHLIKNNLVINEMDNVSLVW